MMETNPLRKIVLILILSQIFLIPAYCQTPDSVQVSTPIWSNQAGTRDVLVQCSGDGKYVVSGSDTGILRMYDQTGKTHWTFQREGKMVRSIAISDGGEYVGAVFLNPDAPSYHADGEILFFNRAGDILWNYADDYTVERIALSDDGNSIYVSGSPKLYSFDRNGTLIRINESQGRTWVLVVSSDGSYAMAGGTITERIHVAGSQTPANRIYAVEKDGTIPWNYSTKQKINSIGISADADTIVNAAGYELSSFTRNGTLRWQLNSGPDITSVAVSSDGEYTAAGSQFYARLFNRTGSLMWRYEYDGFVHDVGISEDGKLIIAGASGGLYAFDQQGNILWNYPTPKAIRHVSMAKSGEYFAAGTADTVYFFNRGGTTKIIEIPTAEQSISPDIVSVNISSPATAPTRSAPLPFMIPLAALGILGVFAGVFRR